MERKNEFNLKDSLQQWQYGLRAERSFTEENIAELQSHLLDNMDELKEKELPEEEAFLLAKYRLGAAPELAGDFRKINKGMIWKERICLMVLGFTGFLFFNTFMLTVSYWYLFMVVDMGFLPNELIWGDAIIKTASVLLLLGIGTLIFKNYNAKITLVKSVIISVVAYVIVALIHAASIPIVTSVVRVEAFGQIAISGKIFSMVLGACLLLSGVIAAFQIKKEKRRQVA